MAPLQLFAQTLTDLRQGPSLVPQYGHLRFLRRRHLGARPGPGGQPERIGEAVAPEVLPHTKGAWTMATIKTSVARAHTLHQ